MLMPRDKQTFLMYFKVICGKQISIMEILVTIHIPHMLYLARRNICPENESSAKEKIFFIGCLGR
ncbi:hypothetical protein JOC77_002237 [Peribacillus deserti]|uniref:Uncharacterized protein n=1 Tax=Peribacillus deserti TaxID=673318 RepID=A0ABS2QI04_9BACI|nr:hypothetical protein [Peribacillus deserti]